MYTHSVYVVDMTNTEAARVQNFRYDDEAGCWVIDLAARTLTANEARELSLALLSYAAQADAEALV